MITFRIDDMTCGHCVKSITQAVTALDRDARVQADLPAHRVHIEAAKADPDALKAAIEEAGYTPVAVPD